MPCIGGELSEDVWERELQLDTQVSVEQNLTTGFFFFSAGNVVHHGDIVLYRGSILLLSKKS